MNVNEESVFTEALEKQDMQERAAFLDQACTGNPGLRQSVDSLLSAYDAGEFLEAGARGLDGTIATPPVEEKPGAEIGPYKLLEQIGEGGMGLVFLAEQVRPMRRHVALKIIKPGMDSKQVIARFEAERQALALMEHPNIARVLDAGTTDSGQPYFVMELVRGIPITDYCDEHRLTIRQRLDLFVLVCQAVQHAHQKGIIHRDLKPTNVLVAHDDTVPLPKVIDFGIAKATSQALTESTLFTGLSQVLGTPLYMSPEQAALNHLDVDTRSDVYSLGVLLYELLTGTTPFERDRLRQAGLDEARRIIREEEPPRPSTIVSTLGAALATVSQRRGVDAGRMSITLRGELDWIVMMALEKDRHRRYESASALAADIQRYLNDEPVHACPPSATYRLRKFALRNKGAMLAATVVIAAFVLGTAGTAIGLMWALAQRDRARDAEEVATARLLEVTAEKERANEEAVAAEAVSNFFRYVLLVQATKYETEDDKKAKIAMIAVLKLVAESVPGRFDKQPRIEAAIRQTIGNTFSQLGAVHKAQGHLEIALELSRRGRGEEHSDTLTIMNDLGLVYFAQRQDAKAESLLAQTLEANRRVRGEENSDTLSVMNKLGEVYRAQGQKGKAEALFTQALEASSRVRGEEHPDTLRLIRNLGSVCEFARAEPLYVKLLELTRRVRGKEDPETIRRMDELAMLYKRETQFAKAELLLLEIMEINGRVLGEKHYETIRSTHNLAVVYRDQGQYAKAEPLLRDHLTLLAQKEPNAWGTFFVQSVLGDVLLAQKKYAEAEPLLLSGYEGMKQRQPNVRSFQIKTIQGLVQLYGSTGEKAKAAEWRQKLDAHGEAEKKKTPAPKGK